MSRDPQAQVNYKSGNVVCDNMRVREDIILSGSVRGHNAAETIKFDNNVQMLRDFCVDGDTTIHGNLLVDGTINEQLPFPLGPFSSIIKTVDLTGKVVVVTGVSRGQGRTIAQQVRAAGAIVIGTSRHAVGYPTPGLFEKPAFIPQVSPLLSTVDVSQTCDYLMRMDLSKNALTTANGAQALTVAPFTLTVNGTTGFPAAGTLTVQTTVSGLQNITYTGLTATSFTGCVAGGAYNIANAGAVYQEGSIHAFSAAVHEMFTTGPLIGLSLYAIVQNAARLFSGDPILSLSNASALNNWKEGHSIVSINAFALVGLLFDLLPTNADARIVFIVSIASMQVAGANISVPYYGAKAGLKQFINGLIELVGDYMVATPGSYTNVRVCGILPDAVRTTLSTYPVVSNVNGDIGLLPGVSVNPGLSLFSPFLAGFPVLEDPEQTGATTVQLLTMLEPPITTFLTNDIFYNDYYSITNSYKGFPPARNINDTNTLLKYNAELNSFAIFLANVGTLGVGFPSEWDVIPAAPGAYINPFTGLQITSAAVPIVVLAAPIGDAGFDFQYNINGGPWLGAGTFTFGAPFPPLYTSTPVNLSAYTGQTITITVRAYTYNGNPVTLIPTGNAIQTEATSFFYKLIIQ